MKIAISAESTIDLTKELLEKFSIFTVPFGVVLGEETFCDGEIGSKEIFEYVDKNGILPKTNAVNSYQFEEHFNKIKKEGYDGIIHFSLSSALSSAYSHAVETASTMENVYIVDTKSLSTGIALLAIYASKLAKKLSDIKEVFERVLKRVPVVQASFTLNNLDYLYKGGRCSSLLRFGANILKLRPQIIVTKEGKMVPGKIYRGKDAFVFKKYILDTLEKFNNPDFENVFITCSSYDQDSINMGIGILKEKGFKNIYCTKAGCTVSSHCGPKCIGILYINDGNQEDQD